MHMCSACSMDVLNTPSSCTSVVPCFITPLWTPDIICLVYVHVSPSLLHRQESGVFSQNSASLPSRSCSGKQ